MDHYKNYIGHFVKRFYAPFNKENIFKIKSHRVNEYGVQEFLYGDDKDEWWSDCEDSCIITNETPIKEIAWVANVNHKEYVGYNPFK